MALGLCAAEGSLREVEWMTIEHFVAVEGAGDGAAAAASSLLMMRGDLGPAFFLLSGRTMSGGSGGLPV